MFTRSSRSISLLRSHLASQKRRLSTFGKQTSFSHPHHQAPFAILAGSALLTLVAVAENATKTTQLDSAVVESVLPLSLDALQRSRTESPDASNEETTDVINWSGTHQVTVPNSKLFEPETVEELESIVKSCHEKGQVMRPLGSSLSPNGIALNENGMISMVHLDKVLEVNKPNMTVTVQAGVTVQRVVEALRPHGMTLPNLASIAEQQMGGFTQVGAHGTGRLVAPVDHYVTKLKLVTPGLGTISLSKEQNGQLFELAKVAVGCLGIVVEVTMQCIPAHKLVEHTFVLSRKQARDQLDDLLKQHKHMRYMWIPYTDSVVCVTNDPESTVGWFSPRNKASPGTPAQRISPLTDLLKTLYKEHDQSFSKEDMEGMGFGELRDALLAFDPLNVEHVKRCNKAEAEFWKRNEGYQTKPSDQLLQFDCGGQQWVFEVCFPTGTQKESNGNDLAFMENLLRGIESQGIPAHSPIEQRWSASSSSRMSPSHGNPGGLHSWVGIINYLPSDDPSQRSAITNLFTGKYCDLVRRVGRPMGMVSHWAKLEQPLSVWKAVDLNMIYRERFPVGDFNKARAALDPKNLLSNAVLDTVLGVPKPTK